MTTTGSRKMDALLTMTAADARRSEIRRAGFATKLVTLVGCLICKACGVPADTFIRMEAAKAAR